MLTQYLIDQAILAGFNFLNSRLDAYRIMRNKKIAHGINFGAYAAIVGFFIWYRHVDWRIAILCGAGAFFNRQLSFDIPLNLRRGLDWYYQSTAVKPKAFWDRVERWVFDNLNGKWIAGIYAGCWLICTIVRIFLIG